jgi:hypothetical protein
MTKRHEDVREIVPELKSFDCFDHHPIEDWVPDTDAVCYWLALHIGEPGSEAASMYYVQVCTPEGLSAFKASGSKISRQRPIVLSHYSWESVLAEVAGRLEACRGYGWLDVQDKLRRQFDWEYENWR